MDDNNYPAESSRAGAEAKVAIPRIKGHDYQLPAATRTTRLRTDVVSKACTQCRKRKIKCSGHRPCCTHCQKQNTECHYDQERKDRLKGAIRKSEYLIELLNQISSQLDAQSRKKVEDILKDYDDDSPPPATPLSATATSQSKRARRTSQSDDQDDLSLTSPEGGEAQYPASVGSNEDLDFLLEDLLPDEEANGIGYQGRNSHAQWLRALETKLERPEGDPRDMPYGPPGASREAFDERAEALHERQHRTGRTGHFTDYYFYLDDDNIELEIGDPHTVPSAATAQKLFEYYKVAVHSPFRILHDLFESQLHMFYGQRQSGVTTNVSSKWKAVMNLVFAIAARYSHLIGAEWQADDRDHLVYMWRAVHLLQLGSITSLISAPDQLLIQATGLLSFYYLTIGHPSKAWYMIGISLRHAQAAGLQLRNEDPSATSSRKETLARIWWGLCSIECVITTITGRPRTVAAKDCTVPPPNSSVEGPKGQGNQMQAPNTQQTHSRPLSSSNTTRPSSSSMQMQGAKDMESFREAYVGLDIITDKILNGLYSARKSVNTWKQVQREIGSLSDELDEWALGALPHGPFGDATVLEPNLSREQLLLFLCYHNAKISITRPCLCRLDERIKGQSEESANFDQKTAKACINAATSMTSLLPSTPNPQWFYENGPWWSTVHTIMQSLTVLLIELGIGGVHLTADKSHITACVEKLIAWLRSMNSIDAVSERAYNMVASVLNKQDQAQAVEKQMPRPSMEETHHKQYDERAPETNAQHPGYNEPPARQLENSWPNDRIHDSALYSESNAGNLYPNDMSGSEFLNNPGAGLFDFTQMELTSFYGNPYQVNFDQYDWNPAESENQDPNQHQGQGYG
ncbi:hypothetical protein EJ02DRAFT_509382 [Clathrospora elynae]|uniref:Zn(2)-C6 fungal-type domain-containing protein n=1 Tax=Clathrospora elynae TaxID=706981 RepID=A0A6A5T9Z5_9PLEO|nr:hypothetical protein EJ02DRAFT_509382 [Clathrospora elynae]